MELQTPIESISCVGCGVVWAMPLDWVQGRRRDHADFYCPACGAILHFSQQSEAERLREQLEGALERASHNERRRCGLQGYVKKLEARLGQKADS
jgi:hypothetical protein